MFIHENRKYFNCDDSCGVFVLRKKVEIILEMSHLFSSNENHLQHIHEDDDESDGEKNINLFDSFVHDGLSVMI